MSFEAVDLTALSASNLTSGTIPDARFPATLPAVSGANLTGINTDLVSDTSPQLGGDLASNGNDIKFANNDKAIFGTGNDAAIYHNDTDFHIDAQASGATRGVYITAGTVSSPFITLRTNDGEKMLECLPNDGVYLYHNNNLKLRTTSAGTEIRGDVHFDNHTNAGKDLYWDESADRLSFSDNVHATFGNGEDLRIYHDGSNSYVRKTTNSGDLYLYNNHQSLMFGAADGIRWVINTSGTFYPEVNNSYDIGTTSKRVRNIYTNDLNLSNEGSSNDVDGTWGSYTIQEGADDLFLINKRNGKKYKFNLTEVS